MPPLQLARMVPPGAGGLQLCNTLRLGVTASPAGNGAGTDGAEGNAPLLATGSKSFCRSPAGDECRHPFPGQAVQRRV